MGIVAFWSGDASTAATRFREVVDGVDEDGRAAHLVRFGQDPQVVCLSRLANAHFFLGDVASARSTVDEALGLAERVGDSYTSHVAHIFAAVLAADLGDTALMARAVEAFRGRPRSGPLLLKSEARWDMSTRSRAMRRPASTELSSPSHAAARATPPQASSRPCTGC